jgi:hydroxymethylpyrimidine pyrophosphatase-like HAD family hydrolase
MKPTYIFCDKDDTLGVRHSLGATIPPETVKVLERLHAMPQVRLITATGRPASQDNYSCRASRIEPSTFDAQIYEDGMLVYFDGEEIFSSCHAEAAEHRQYRVNQHYPALMASLHDLQGMEFLRQQGYLLVNDGLVLKRQDGYYVYDMTASILLSGLGEQYLPLSWAGSRKCYIGRTTG